MAGKETWKKWFRRDNLLILILSGVLLFIITLPIEGKDSDENVGRSGENISEDAEGFFSESRNDTGNQNVNSATNVVSSDRAFAAELEAQLEGLLSEMADVGKVKVMITLKTSEELVVEKDEPVARSSTNESDSAGGSRTITQLDSAESTVYRTSGSESEPYVIKTISPQVEGVVVVAQGAGSGTVNQNITEMVQALFDVEAHKVKVVKMATSK